MNLESCTDNLLVHAEEGDPEAQFNLGEYYRLKNGVGSIAVAAEWFLKAAIQDYAPAQMALALLYLDGLQPEEYERDARYWLQKAAQSGCEAAVKVLVKLAPREEYVDGCDLLVAADEGDPQAQFELGYMLLWGQGRPRDVSAGLNLLFKAAIAGHPQAQVQIASRYLFGEYGAADGAEAIKWLNLSAKQNEPYALYYLGYCFYEGIGVLKNDEQAAAHLLRSAQMGNSEAQFQLGRFYYEGVVFTENHEQAQSWLQAAALQGHEDAKEFTEWRFS